MMEWEDREGWKISNKIGERILMCDMKVDS